MRIGLGHDIHSLHEGEPLVLAGVHIPSKRGFRTHSDGDVVCHALIDALAGAMAFGDLGVHFPEDDPLTEDAPSIEFVKSFLGVVASRGFEVVNIDCSITLKAPMILPFVDEMRQSLASVLSTDPDSVSVKGRSNDGIGPEGRGEAASAQVVVLIQQTTSA